jgi:hypothetical protein
VTYYLSYLEHGVEVVITEEDTKLSFIETLLQTKQTVTIKVWQHINHEQEKYMRLNLLNRYVPIDSQLVSSALQKIINQVPCNK